jgi:membrane associated rhomboid family serine protease
MVRTISDYPNNNNAQGAGAQSFIPKDIPTFFFIFCIIGLISIPFMAVQIYLLNYPILTIGSLHLWTPFTCLFISGGLIQLLFGVLMMYFMCNQFEKTLGTGRFIADIFYKHLLV